MTKKLALEHSYICPKSDSRTSLLGLMNLNPPMVFIRTNMVFYSMLGHRTSKKSENYIIILKAGEEITVE